MQIICGYSPARAPSVHPRPSRMHARQSRWAAYLWCLGCCLQTKRSSLPSPHHTPGQTSAAVLACAGLTGSADGALHHFSLQERDIIIQHFSEIGYKKPIKRWGDFLFLISQLTSQHSSGFYQGRWKASKGFPWEQSLFPLEITRGNALPKHAAGPNCSPINIQASYSHGSGFDS